MLARAADDTPRRVIGEFEAKQRLRAAGVCVPDGAVVAGGDAAAAAARAIGYPVAVKAAGIAHKSDAGGARLNIADEKSLRQALDDMSALSDAFLIERMVDDVAAELLVGFSRDCLAGWVLTVGAGGIWTEALRDTATLLLPADAAAVFGALSSLRAAALWRGGRGRVAGDEAAAIKSILALSDFVLRHKDALLELEINPLLMRHRGAAVAADALLAETEIKV